MKQLVNTDSFQTIVSNNGDASDSAASQMTKLVNTIVNSDHLTAVIFSSRIWFPDSILRDNAGHQSARRYIEGWI